MKWLAKGSKAALAVYWLAMFAGTHYPKPEQISPNVSDKLLHFGAYAGLTWLWVLVIVVRRPLHLRDGLWIGLGLAVYGALDELLQIPVGRHCDINDWYADMGGVAGALVAAYLVQSVWLRFRGPRAQGPEC